VWRSQLERSSRVFASVIVTGRHAADCAGGMGGEDHVAGGGNQSERTAAVRSLNKKCSRARRLASVNLLQYCDAAITTIAIFHFFVYSTGCSRKHDLPPVTPLWILTAPRIIMTIVQPSSIAVLQYSNFCKFLTLARHSSDGDKADVHDNLAGVSRRRSNAGGDHSLRLEPQLRRSW
jgi:hypothetical protein